MTRTVAGYQVFYPEALIDAAAEATRTILRSGQLVLGPFTRQFEAAWASMMGQAHGVACSSDSAALEMALRAVDVRGRAVLLPAVSFFGDVVAITRAGGMPVFVDCTIDNGVFPTSAQVQEAAQAVDRAWVRTLGRRGPAAFLAVYTAGTVGADLDETIAWLTHQGIPTIEDCAHTLGTTLNGRNVGSFGALSCFSFFATKVVSTGGEGGLVCTNDADTDRYLRMFRNYGRGQTWGTGLAKVDGYNWRMTEWQAAIGCLLATHFHQYIATRREIVEWYRAQWPRGLTELPTPPGVLPGYYRLIGLLPRGWNKQAFKIALAARGVGLQGDVYEVTAPAQPVFRGAHGTPTEAAATYPQATEFCDRHVCLPIHQQLTRDDVGYVCAAVTDVLGGVPM